MIVIYVIFFAQCSDFTPNEWKIGCFLNVQEAKLTFLVHNLVPPYSSFYGLCSLFQKIFQCLIF